MGKITLLQGDPGDGKSTMILNLIAEISKGGSTPDGKELGCPQRVIYQCSEDDTADTIKPRLILRFIALKMSILRVDAAIIKRKKVKRNVYSTNRIDVA